MARGRKRVKGVPELHDELKTRVNLSLTPTAVMGLDNLANQQGLSRSELVELIGRQQLSINVPTDDEESLLFTNLTTSGMDSMVFSERDNLPFCAGVYLVYDKDFRIYSGYTVDLYQEFHKESFLQSLYRFYNEFEQDKGYQEFHKLASELNIYYVQCHDKSKYFDFFQKMLLNSFWNTVSDYLNKPKLNV